MEIYKRILKEFNSKPFCGTGSVIVPSDVERDDYIATCFAEETISFIPTIGGMSYNHVPVSLEALQHIEFPDEGNTFGSQVVYILHPVTKNPIVVAVLDRRTELSGVEYKQFKFFKTLKGKFASILGDGGRGVMSVSVGGDSESGGGKIFVNVYNSDFEGILSLSVQGDIQVVANNLIVSNKATKIKSLESVEVATKETKVTISDKVVVGDGGEPMVLGKTLKDEILKPLMNTIKSLSVDTSTGVVMPDTVAEIEAIQAKLDKILSEVGELE